MLSEFEVLVTFLLFLLFFGWIGFRRGTLPELIVLAVAVIAWFGLQRFGSIVAQIFNLGFKLLGGVFNGALVSGDLSAVAAVPNVITAENERGFFFLLWGLTLLLTYILTGRFVKDPNAIGNAGWAALLGIANALFLSAILLPRLLSLVLPGSISPETLSFDLGVMDVIDIIGSAISILLSGLSRVWAAIEPRADIAILLLITLFLIFAASTLSTRNA